MAIKKSELYSSLWASCDELRGGMDASQYKDYVLVLLFIKYISEFPATLTARRLKIFRTLKRICWVIYPMPILTLCTRKEM